MDEGHQGPPAEPSGKEKIVFFISRAEMVNEKYWDLECCHIGVRVFPSRASRVAAKCSARVTSVLASLTAPLKLPSLSLLAIPLAKSFNGFSGFLLTTF